MKTPDNDAAKKNLKELLESFDDAMLVTHAQNHDLHARPMALVQVDGEGDLWFATGLTTGKVLEIENDARVTVTFQGKLLYVTVSGRAQLVKDRKKVDEVWSEPLRTWFPNGKDDPNLVLLRVKADRAEYWDNRGAKGLSYLWEAAKAYVTGTTPDVDGDGQHAKVRS